MVPFLKVEVNGYYFHTRIMYSFILERHSSHTHSVNPEYCSNFNWIILPLAKKLSHSQFLTLLHSEQPKCYGVLAILSAKGLNYLFLQWKTVLLPQKLALMNYQGDLTLKAPNKNCSRQHFYLLLLSLEENKA